MKSSMIKFRISVDVIDFFSSLSKHVQFLRCEIYIKIKSKNEVLGISPFFLLFPSFLFFSSLDHSYRFFFFEGKKRALTRRGACQDD